MSDTNLDNPADAVTDPVVDAPVPETQPEETVVSSPAAVPENDVSANSESRFFKAVDSEGAARALVKREEDDSYTVKMYGMDNKSFASAAEAAEYVGSDIIGATETEFNTPLVQPVVDAGEQQEAAE